MGENQNGPFQLSFNVSPKVDFQGSRVTSDGGLILVRELDQRSGLGELIAQQLTDPRGRKARAELLAFLGEKRAQGWSGARETPRTGSSSGLPS
jgi:hypothetical protein